MVAREIYYSHAHVSLLKTCVKVGFAKMQHQFRPLNGYLKLICYDDLGNVAHGGSSLGHK